MERYWDIEYRGKGENAEWMKCLQKSQTLNSYKDSELAFGHVHNIWWIERKDLGENSEETNTNEEAEVGNGQGMSNTKVTGEAETDVDDQDGNEVALGRHRHGQGDSNSQGRSVS